MRKLLALILAALLLLCTVGCAAQSGDGSVSSSASQSVGGGIVIDSSNSATVSWPSVSDEDSISASLCSGHKDVNGDNVCDNCSVSVLWNFDFYSVNDLHGKFKDTDSQIGVNEMTTYLKQAKAVNPNTMVLSAGDMWQGSSESNLTRGNIITEWMNELEFVAMTLGNHEYDWGEEPIKDNAKIANFPFLGINIYDSSTNKRVDYCKSSVFIDAGVVQIGIIGAIGDCYSSIAADMRQGVYFVTGDSLTQLVKKESQNLKAMGADFIIYMLHDGYGGTNYGPTIDDSSLSGYYNVALSNGYVDLVFEGHTHKYYTKTDKYGVSHLQGGGDNLGISHADVDINIATGEKKVNGEYISSSKYSYLSGDTIVDKLLNKYADEVGKADEILGTNAYQRNSNAIRNIVAELYYKAGVQKWGKDYKIVLGGGFLNVRSPGYLAKGDVTYGNLQMLLPFDNQLVLCSIKGTYLKSKFFETTNTNYFIYYESYGQNIKNKIDPNATYYIIVDSYTSTYAPNKLTEIARYDTSTFARDLLAEYIKQGNLAK